MRRNWCSPRLALVSAALMLWGLPALPQSANLAGNHIERLDARFDSLVPPGAELELVADGFDWVEGPLWHSKGGYLLFSDVPKNSIFRWDPKTGVSLFLARSGYTGKAVFDGPEPGSNGLDLVFSKDLVQFQTVREKALARSETGDESAETTQAA